jgi:hypothetical protein
MAVDAPHAIGGLLVADEVPWAAQETAKLELQPVEVVDMNHIMNAFLYAAQPRNADGFVNFEPIFLDPLVLSIVPGKAKILLDTSVRFNLHQDLDLVGVLRLRVPHVSRRRRDLQCD